MLRRVVTSGRALCALRWLPNRSAARSNRLRHVRLGQSVLSSRFFSTSGAEGGLHETHEHAAHAPAESGEYATAEGSSASAGAEGYAANADEGRAPTYVCGYGDVWTPFYASNWFWYSNAETVSRDRGGVIASTGFKELASRAILTTRAFVKRDGEDTPAIDCMTDPLLSTYWTRREMMDPNLRGEDTVIPNLQTIQEVMYRCMTSYNAGYVLDLVLRNAVFYYNPRYVLGAYVRALGEVPNYLGGGSAGLLHLLRDFRRHLRVTYQLLGRRAITGDDIPTIQVMGGEGRQWQPADQENLARVDGAEHTFWWPLIEEHKLLVDAQREAKETTTIMSPLRKSHVLPVQQGPEHGESSAAAILNSYSLVPLPSSRSATKTNMLPATMLQWPRVTNSGAKSDVDVMDSVAAPGTGGIFGGSQALCRSFLLHHQVNQISALRLANKYTAKVFFERMETAMLSKFFWIESKPHDEIPLPEWYDMGETMGFADNDHSYTVLPMLVVSPPATSEGEGEPQGQQVIGVRAHPDSMMVEWNTCLSQLYREVLYIFSGGTKGKEWDVDSEAARELGTLLLKDTAAGAFDPECALAKAALGPAFYVDDGLCPVVHSHNNVRTLIYGLQHAGAPEQCLVLMKLYEKLLGDKWMEFFHDETGAYMSSGQNDALRELRNERKGAMSPRRRRFNSRADHVRARKNIRVAEAASTIWDIPLSGVDLLWTEPVPVFDYLDADDLVVNNHREKTTESGVSCSLHVDWKEDQDPSGVLDLSNERGHIDHPQYDGTEGEEGEVKEPLSEGLVGVRDTYIGPARPYDESGVFQHVVAPEYSLFINNVWNFVLNRSEDAYRKSLGHLTQKGDELPCYYAQPRNGTYDPGDVDGRFALALMQLSTLGDMRLHLPRSNAITGDFLRKWVRIAGLTGDWQLMLRVLERLSTHPGRLSGEDAPESEPSDAEAWRAVRDAVKVTLGSLDHGFYFLSRRAGEIRHNIASSRRKRSSLPRVHANLKQRERQRITDKRKKLLKGEAALLMEMKDLQHGMGLLQRLWGEMMAEGFAVQKRLSTVYASLDDSLEPEHKELCRLCNAGTPDMLLRNGNSDDATSLPQCLSGFSNRTRNSMKKIMQSIPEYSSDDEAVTVEEKVASNKDAMADSVMAGDLGWFEAEDERCVRLLSSSAKRNFANVSKRIEDIMAVGILHGMKQALVMRQVRHRRGDRKGSRGGDNVFHRFSFGRDASNWAPSHFFGIWVILRARSGCAYGDNVKDIRQNYVKYLKGRTRRSQVLSEQEATAEAISDTVQDAIDNWHGSNDRKTSVVKLDKSLAGYSLCQFLSMCSGSFDKMNRRNNKYWGYNEEWADFHLCLQELVTWCCDEGVDETYVWAAVDQFLDDDNQWRFPDSSNNDAK